MNKLSRIFLFGVLALALLTAACAEATPTTIVLTTGPGEATASPFPVETEATASPVGSVDMTATVDTATVPAGTELTQTPGADTTQTAEVPITGGDLILLECQFCIQDVAHALLVLPDTASFETVADTAAVDTPGPDMGCNTVDTYNGRQVVICRSQENTPVSLNICTDGNNCTQLLIELQDCPNIVQPGATATGTLEVGTPAETPAAGVTDTPGAIAPTATP